MPRYEFKALLTVEAKDEEAAAYEAERAMNICERNALLLSLEDGPPAELDADDEEGED